jgi:hypothetical protein
VHRLPLAEFAYNNNIHASTSVTLFFAEKGSHPRIEATVWAVPADGYVPDVPDAKAKAEKLMELCTAIKQCWKEVTATQRKYADSHTKPH